MKKATLTPIITLALGLLALPATAKSDKGNKGGNPGKGGHKQEKHEKQEKFEKHEKFEKNQKHQHGDGDHFDDNELNQILRLFRGNDGQRQLPPGLEKNLKRGKPLPPGWQKKLAPGARLDDDIWNALTPLSYDMFPGMRRTPNTRLYYHDNRVLRVMDATRVILDVININ